MIKIAGPDWAEGCEHCMHGVVRAPDVTVEALYISRAVLWHHGWVQFCDCRAGRMAQAYTAATWREIMSGNERLHSATIAAILAAAAATVQPEEVSHV